MLADSLLTDSELAQWCERALGSAPSRLLFRAGYLSQVVGVELKNGQRVVVKARPFEERIAGCVAVQAELARTGFPCPVPLAGPARLGDLAVTAEELVEGGEQLSRARGAAPFATLLAQLLKAAPDVATVPDLSPSPPWTAWDHPGDRVWPDRDDQGRDLNLFSGPAWLDRAARLARDRLRSCGDPRLVGHGDWESQNIDWRDGKPLAVHDWDSVIAQPEVAVAGLAAAVWPRSGAPADSATPAQTTEFLIAYQDAAGARWTTRQIQLAWAAGLWVRLVDAKMAAAEGGGPQLDRLVGEMDERLANAGLSE